MIHHYWSILIDQVIINSIEQKNKYWLMDGYELQYYARTIDHYEYISSIVNSCYS